MTMPNFLIIGAGKSGTTALNQYLKQHPQIFMSPIKEPRYFAYEEGTWPDYQGPGDEGACSSLITRREDYEKLFAGVSDEKAIGEASTMYLYSPSAPRRIKEAIPDVRLIAILRNPVDRAYSNYLHMVREGREPLDDFALALEEEPRRIAENWMPAWHYKARGFYYQQLKRYYDYFDREQICVVLYQDYNQQPHKVLKDLFQFLGVDCDFSPDTTIRFNLSGIPRSRLWHRLLTRPNLARELVGRLMPQALRQHMAFQLRKRNLLRPVLPATLRRQLIAEYRIDIMELQTLIARDLTAWLQGCHTDGQHVE